MKTCNKCNEEKPLSAYYACKGNKDGHFNECKECTKARVTNHRNANIDRVRAYDRSRANKPHRVKARKEYAEKIKKDPSARDKYNKRSALWRQKNKLKRAAHIILGNAKKYGKIISPNECSKCRASCVPDAHHEDYNKPLDVVWLCKPCHGARHAEIREEIRSGVDWSERGF